METAARNEMPAGPDKMIQQNLNLDRVGGIEPMHLIKKGGVTLAYEDINPGSPPMLFVHGWGCDHSVFAPQAEFFSRSHRVVSVDLRGHGRSDAPHQDYTMAVFADDIAWLCTELALNKPVVVGHSMGGNVALEFAARYPEIPASIVLVDSVILPRKSFSIGCSRLQKRCEGRTIKRHINRRSRYYVLRPMIIHEKYNSSLPYRRLRDMFLCPRSRII